MKYYIISGEASGDLHGSNLLKAIYQQDNNANIRCWGGEKMQQTGATLVKHYKDLAFMGFVEVLKHLKTIFKNIAFCQQDILAFNPDVLVFIDYPGFNLRIAKWAKGKNIKTVYYISPQVWAWKEGRVRFIKKHIDKMLVILPFEKEFYRKWGFDVIYTGHPLVDVVQDEEKKNIGLIGSKPIIALLPGSREQEVNKNLPTMLSVVASFSQYQFVIAQAPSLPTISYQKIINVHPEANILLLQNQTYNILRQAKAALVASGTATLETALFGVPQIVCYKANPITVFLAKNLIRIKYISLVNLILDKPVIKELIQKDFTKSTLLAELSLLLFDHEKQAQIKNDYKLLKDCLGDKRASDIAAKEIISFIN